MLNDLRYAFRQLLKNPGFTTVAVLTLALGIGATTAIFSVANAVLFRPLGFMDPSRLVMVWETIPKNPQLTVRANVDRFLHWKKNATSFERIAALTPASYTLTSQGEAERIGGAFISSDFLTLLGVKPALGRDFFDEETQPGKHNVVLISHGLWQRRFSGAPEVLGSAISLDDKPYAIVGVLPPGFEFPTLKAEVCLPLVPDPSSGVWVTGRLKPGVNVRQAQAELQHLTATFFQAHQDWTPREVALVPLQEQGVADVRSAILLLLGAVGMLLLIATANVSNLILARAVGRTKELAMRIALGARRRHLARQLLAESLVLSVMACAAGLLMAFWWVDFFVAMGPTDILRLQTTRIDIRVLAFSLGLAVLTAVLSGLAPLLQASRVELSDAVKQGGRKSTGGSLHNRARRVVAIVQVSLAIVLSIGAGLMARSFWLLTRVDPGFDMRQLLAAQMPLPSNRFTGHQRRDFLEGLLERVQFLPGVSHAAVADNLPLSGSSLFYFINIEGSGSCEGAMKTEAHAVSPDYFRTMRIPLRKGRLFDRGDNATASGSIIISQTLASRCFPDTDPLGRTLQILTDNQFRKIVGIVGDVKHGGLETSSVPEMYLSYFQAPPVQAELVVRTATDPADLARAVKKAVWEINKSQPITRVSTMEQVAAGLSAQRRFYTLLLVVFAITASLLAAIGIYGVVAYSVSQRTHEIGIRLALGAKREDVATLAIKEGMILVLLGGPIGLAAALALTPLLRSWIFQIGTADPATFMIITLILTGIALLASYVPARRAARVDPIEALRCE